MGHIFVIHGRNKNALQELKAFIRKCGYDCRTFGDVRGRLGGAATVQEVIRHGLDGASAALVFLTPDQLVFLDPRLRETENDRSTWETRPNVMFEAGMAYAAEPKRTILLAMRGVSLPSDLHGLDVIYFDEDGGRDTLRERLSATTEERLVTLTIDSTGNNNAPPPQAARLRFSDAFLTDLMDRLGTRHLGSPAEYSAADVLRSTAALFQDWRGKPARKLITEISRRYSGQVTEWGYWWLIVDGVLTFKDPYDWWDEEPEWKQSVDYSEITPTGVLLLNLISAGYFGKAEQPLTLREAPAREGPKIKRRKRRRS